MHSFFLGRRSDRVRPNADVIPEPSKAFKNVETQHVAAATQRRARARVDPASGTSTATDDRGKRAVATGTSRTGSQARQHLASFSRAG